MTDSVNMYVITIKKELLRMEQLFFMTIKNL